jgi:predicted dinucleotide-binding enzyme
MNLGVFGTGGVGRALAARLVGQGHAVMVGTRNPAITMSRPDTDSMGGPPYHEWAAQNQNVGLGTFAESAEFGEMLINATKGSRCLQVLRLAGEKNLNGKILLDVSNPLDGEMGFPPGLFVSNIDSLGEQLQRAFPEVKVVKSLNTVTAALMVDPRRLGGGDHTIFLSGNDAGAKEKVRELLRSFGWKDILDLGDISTARGPEMYLPLWLRLWGATGTGMMNIRIVR